MVEFNDSVFNLLNIIESLLPCLNIRITDAKNQFYLLTRFSPQMGIYIFKQMLDKYEKYFYKMSRFDRLVQKNELPFIGTHPELYENWLELKIENRNRILTLLQHLMFMAKPELRQKITSKNK
jgi:hypothetical protein